MKKSSNVSKPKYFVLVVGISGPWFTYYSDSRNARKHLQECKGAEYVKVFKCSDESFVSMARYADNDLILVGAVPRK